jgi:hypothetical protein
MIRKLRSDWGKGRKQPIKGTYTWEVVKVLERLGCKVTKLTMVENTIGRFVEDMKHLDHVFLVEVTGHFVVVHKDTLSDSFLRPNRQVQKVWRVEAPAEPRYKAPTPKPPKPKPDIKQVRRERVVQRLAAWQSKLKRAESAIRKLNRQVRYYSRAA